MDFRVIKENDLFLLTDKSGDIPRDQKAGYGLYTRDTRYLSNMELLINGRKPILLSSQANQNFLSTIYLTNPHIEEDGKIQLWRESIQIERKRFIYHGVFYESIHLTNFNPKPIEFTISLRFDADFCDMFIVRGFQYGKTGEKVGTVIEPRKMEITYLGADQITRKTSISWNRDADLIEENRITFRIALKPKELQTLSFTIAPIMEGEIPERLPVDEAIHRLNQSYEEWNQRATQIDSDSEIFNAVYQRSIQDLRVLLTDLGHGPFPVAGLPWFAVPFGRDSLITALQMLPLNPEIAKGTLLTMAAYQGKKEDSWRDEQPGKVMHEIRYGELANTNQIPFTPYYGTIDATPLFLILAIEYFHWTNDLETIRQLLPNIERALEWINRYGDRDGDGFVEYFQESSKGIGNQGWKDSGDSIIHRNGDYAKAPIALVEVQGYVYQAKTKLIPILELLGRQDLADTLKKEAAQLKILFDQAFWMPDENYYAIALDSEKKKVESVTSNPGHLLMSGILEPNKALQVAKRLVQDDMFSGYGIRTMSKRSAGFNPMSYHNGSVWPHDNSVALLGLSLLGCKEEAAVVIEGLLRAAQHFEYQRLPELFCGYDADLGYPVPYPVACSPQAWAAGTAIVMLQTLLGIWPNSIEKNIQINPLLIDGMNRLHVKNIRIGEGVLEIVIQRNGSNLETVILKNTTGYEIVESREYVR